jgi:hypothetical protein
VRLLFRCTASRYTSRSLTRSAFVVPSEESEKKGRKREKVEGGGVERVREQRTQRVQRRVDEYAVVLQRRREEGSRKRRREAQ